MWSDSECFTVNTQKYLKVSAKKRKKRARETYSIMRDFHLRLFKSESNSKERKWKPATV